MNILVAEDNLVIQKLLVKLFTKNNCNAIVVNNGQEVLDYLANPLNPRPNLIFLDHAMPVMGGLETARILLTQPPFAMDPILRATPIIGMEPHGTMAPIPGYNRGYIVDILQKPVRESHVRMMLLKWSRREWAPPGPGPVLGSGLGDGMASRPVWGPFPFRKYRGPRSLL